jgi:hypothetical protein
MPFSPRRQGMLPKAELRHRAPQRRGVGLGGRQVTSETVSEGVNELKPLERFPQSDDHLVMTMKLKYPKKTATVEEEATVLSLLDLLGYSSFPLTVMEGALANADLAPNSEVVALYQPRVTGSLLYEGGTVALCATEIG